MQCNKLCKFVTRIHGCQLLSAKLIVTMLISNIYAIHAGEKLNHPSCRSCVEQARNCRYGIVTYSGWPKKCRIINKSYLIAVKPDNEIRFFFTNLQGQTITIILSLSIKYFMRDLFFDVINIVRSFVAAK